MAGLLHPLRFEGRVHQHELACSILDGGRCDDPTTRHLYVYEPPGCEGRDLPAVLLLPGFTGTASNLLEVHPWKTGVVAAYDRAVAAGEHAPALLVLPDCWTRLGGSQYVNSTYFGRYTDHLVQEVVPFVREHHGAAAFGVAGKSSGGFGAMHLSLAHPEAFRAAGSISGDVDFELGYASEFAPACRGLVDHGADPAAFLEAFLRDPTLKGDDHAVLNVLAMAGCYSPAPGAELGFELPFDPRTAERRPEVWERWLAFDPLVRIGQPAAQEAWRSLACLHLECGLKDQFHLQWGLRKLSARLTELGIEHDHEEHPGSHFDINDRYGPVIDKLARALTS